MVCKRPGSLIIRIQNCLLTCDVKIELILIISHFFKDVHWGTVCSFSGLIGFIVSLLLMIVLENQTCLPDSIFDRAYIVLIGVLSFAGQVTLVYLAKIESNLHTESFWNIIIQWTSHDDLTEKLVLAKPLQMEAVFCQITKCSCNFFPFDNFFGLRFDTILHIDLEAKRMDGSS